MYIRVKRSKTTYFLQCDPTETILDVKQKLHTLIDQPINDQRLILVGTGEILDDSKTLADQKVPIWWLHALYLMVFFPLIMYWGSSNPWFLILIKKSYVLFGLKISYGCTYIFKEYLRLKFVITLSLPNLFRSKMMLLWHWHWEKVCYFAYLFSISVSL